MFENSVFRVTCDRIPRRNWYYVKHLPNNQLHDRIMELPKDKRKFNPSLLCWEISAESLASLIKRYKGSNKDLRFDDEYIESLLNIRYGEGRCRALLHLLFPEMNPTEVFHIDHLHPRNHFSKKYLEKLDYIANSPEKLSFYENPEYWDTIPNLHLLNHSQNISKQDTSLKQWLSQPSNNYSPSMLLVSDENIEFSRFPEFYNERRNALKQRLLNRVFLTTKIDSSPSTMDTDEEILTD